MRLHTLQADPAGNITLFVLDPVDPSCRPAIAAALMRQIPTVEQVGFVTKPLYGGMGRLEMMGGEFCGNACRAFGFLLAQERFFDGIHPIAVEESGAAAPVPVVADLYAGRSEALMPLPISVCPFPMGEFAATLVIFEGISHLVIPRTFDDALLLAGQEYLCSTRAEAWGVLFLAPSLAMTPVVTVRSTGTTVFEGSCGSGSVAAACALALKAGEGKHRYSFAQPRGTIEASVTVQNGKIAAASIGGTVMLGGVMEIDVDAG